MTTQHAVPDAELEPAMAAAKAAVAGLTRDLDRTDGHMNASH
jgi:hypothetical protein